MSNYKNYLLTAMGLPKSKIDEINKKELAMGEKEESEEHGMSKAEAEKTALDHLEEPDHAHYYSGMKKAEKQKLFKEKTMYESFGDNLMFSPTAIPTPVIGGAVRGSSTGGLPSGADQNSDITPSKFGGYEKSTVEPVNSKLINKTPVNPEINNSNPINDDPSLEGGVTHPHQVQTSPNEEPQAITGASTDSDSSLTLKSAMPKGIDIDIAEDDNFIKNTDDYSEEPADMNSHIKKDLDETFSRHKKLMSEKLKEKVGASEPFVNKFEMDKEKAGMVKVEEKQNGLVRISEAFERIGVLSGLIPARKAASLQIVEAMRSE